MEHVPRFTKTRIAPTPSGYLHRGNAFSFWLTAALARKTGAKLLLRIDDLDQKRVRRAYLEDIFETLHFLGIRWDEGPSDVEDFEARFAQRHRLHVYRNALEQLREDGHLFACNCTRTSISQHSADGSYPGTCRQKKLPLDTPGVCWRLHTTTDKPLQVKHWNGTISTTPLPSSMTDFIVRKKDEMPSYHLASVVDDLRYGVDLVVRGKDLWPSTLAQLYLASLLGQNNFSEVSFYHHPLLTDANGNKLSKSAGAEGVRFLRQKGWQLDDWKAWLAEGWWKGEKLESFVSGLDRRGHVC